LYQGAAAQASRLVFLRISVMLFAERLIAFALRVHWGMR
jgi:hypothetical protein